MCRSVVVGLRGPRGCRGDVSQYRSTPCCAVCTAVRARVRALMLRMSTSMPRLRRRPCAGLPVSLRSTWQYAPVRRLVAPLRARTLRVLVR